MPKQQLTRRQLLTALLASGLTEGVWSSVADMPSQIPLLVHPFDNPRRLFARFHPFTRWLSNQQTTVKLSLLSSYQEQLERITCQKQHSLAYLGPSTFYLAQGINPNIQPLAMETIAQKTHFRALLLCRSQDAEQLSLLNLKQQRLAIGDELSLGSTLYPFYLLKQLNIQPNQLASIEHYKNHDQILQALLHHQADFGCVREDIAEAYLERGLHALHSSPPLPPHIVVASQSTPKELCTQITQQLTQHKPNQQSALASLGNQRGFTHYDARAYTFMPNLFNSLTDTDGLS